MTTREAYHKLITSHKPKELGLLLDVSRGYLKRHKYVVKHGQYPSLETMEKRLLMAGFTVAQEKLWIDVE